MPKGGKRPGAGRPPGSVTKRSRRIADMAARGKGELPLQYFLRIMRDPRQPKDRRDRLAIAAAPFIHPRLNAVEHSGGLTLKTHEQALDELDDGEGTADPAQAA